MGMSSFFILIVHLVAKHLHTHSFWSLTFAFDVFQKQSDSTEPIHSSKIFSEHRTFTDLYLTVWNCSYHSFIRGCVYFCFTCGK